MFGKRQSKPQNRIDSLISAETKVDGNISFAGGLRIDGEVNGNVIAAPGKSSTLVVSELGHVNGDINVMHLVVNGEINGMVQVGEYLELQSKAKVRGDVCYKAMEIQLGAIVEGKLMHLAEEASDKVIAFKLAGSESSGS